MTTRSPRRVAWSLSPVLVALAFGTTRSQEAAKLLRGPAVTLDKEGLAVEIAVAEGTKDLKLATTVAGKTVETRFEAVPNEPKLRAAFPRELAAGSKVAYEVLAGKDSLARKELKTLPARDATKLTFVALGDSGFPVRGEDQAGWEQLAVAKLMAKIDPDVAIHTGDVIYLTGQETGIVPLFFAPYADTLARVPFFACLGNHDVKTEAGKPELAAFPHPSNPNANRYYSFDVASAHFVCIDSNEPMRLPEGSDFGATAQGKWLKADLAASRAPWKIAYFHHPLYSGFPKRANEQARMQHALEAILQEGGVELCVNGHDHFYHRTARLLGGKADESGIAHVLTGGGGASLYPPEPVAITAAHAERFHLVRFDVDGDTIQLVALAPKKTGEPDVIDKCEIVAKHRKRAD